MTDKTKTPDAPLVLPPVADFIAWLRANPDRVFHDNPNARLTESCPLAVFFSERFGEPMVVTSMRAWPKADNLVKSRRDARLCDATNNYYTPRQRIDTLSTGGEAPVTAAQILTELDKPVSA